MPDNEDNDNAIADEIKKLVFRRGQLKGSLTRFATFVKGLNPDVTGLKLRLNKLDSIWAEFQVVQSRLEELDITRETERISFEDEYYNLASFAIKLIEQHEQSVLRGANTNANIQANQPLSMTNNIAKLQAISLPQFSGSYEGWLQFYEIFQSLVDKNPDLSKIQKFYYLQSCLRGEAIQVLQSLEICEANYDEAIKLLRERYQNKRVLIHNHVRNLFDIQGVSKESHQALRKLIDTVVRNLRALTGLQQPVDQWDTLLIYLISQKIDSHTRKEWEIFNKKDSPTFEEFLTFLKNKCQVLETIDNNSHTRVLAHVSTSDSTNLPSQNQARQFNSNFNCNFCGQNDHFAYKCSKLLALSCKDRYVELKRLGICTNCLKPGHISETCNGKTCRVCNRKHNSILHDYNFNYYNKSLPSSNSIANPQSNISNSQKSCNLSVNNSTSESNQNSKSLGRVVQSGNVEPTGRLESPASETSLSSVNACSYSYQTAEMVEKPSAPQILLATAVVYILDSNNKAVKCRALLDSASQSNFCSKQLYQQLNLPCNKINIPVLGINNASCNISAQFKTKITSLNGSFRSNIDLLVIDKVTTKLPQISFDPLLLKIPQNLELADPGFGDSQNIDILIGTELFFRCLNSEKIMLGQNAPILQNTKFGWVLAGPLYINTNKNFNHNVQCMLTINDAQDKILQSTVQKFWQIENIDSKQNKLTSEELECEMHFRKNVECDFDGRYIVKLPLKENYLELGESHSIALKCLLSLEKRLERNPDLRQQYTEFLKEYETLGHMSRINPNLDKSDEPCVYLSHHAVLKNTSSTTKLRVVFNASLKTNSGLSLNDVLKIGPKVQKDVFDIVLRMRTYPILIVADIEKMYRMILIHESQRKFQRILWREDTTKEVAHYQLNTVTYGTASASFLATRVLHEIGQKYKDLNPEVSDIIINNFYMDDLIFGHHDVKKAIQLKNQIDEILLSSGFKLRKWMSNDSRVLQSTNEAQLPNEQFYIRGDIETKTLGTVWNPNADTISYKFELNINTHNITKRTVLAGIGQLFDILGLISPVIVKAKLILQEIWKNQLDWDTKVPQNIADEWLDFVNKLSHLNFLQIPRCVLVSNFNEHSIILCGFCDASLAAYGACVYLISQDKNEKIDSYLICAKSRLAPLSSMSLPRLELCGALLLAQLIERVVIALESHITEINLFTDSTIVLDWLSSEPSNWKVFISNRVAEIQRLTENMIWCHIDTENNPADIVSRGADLVTLQNQPLWWYGPSFLRKGREYWPDRQKVKIIITEARKEDLSISFPVVKQNVTVKDANEIFFKWSSYTKLLRVFCYIYRFYNNIRCNNKITGHLTIQELDIAVLNICKLVQSERFTQEIRTLKSNQRLNSNSKIISLNPFLDNSGTLRVGGRLTNSDLKFERKHPIILPSNHQFVNLLIKYYHHKFLHAGPQFILTQIRDKFWLINGRNEVRKVLKNCITCFRVKPTTINQMMGSLPTSRVVPSRPFLCCGVDYAGPYSLKDGKTRNRIIIKAYICIFICLSTRAVHAELVTDLSAEAFLNAFKRFVSRRGLCSQIFSDNATNFVGSNNELMKLCQIVRETVSNKYQKYFKEHRVTWHFIPARSPHHGGIWESAVRSFKYHLKRILGDTHLNFEHFYTLLTQIEAILNSRPILPLTNDPSDMVALTPGHFLIGESLIAVPQSNDINIPSNRLRHYKHLQQIVQRFWSVWSKDYLNSLQQRSKWRSRQENIQVGTLVLLKEDNEPPMHWPLGRVVSVHPGNDNLVRVVSVRTKGGILQRAITKICPLPTEADLL